MWTEKDKVNCVIRQLKLSIKSHIKYMPFANSTRQERIGGLQLNKYNNMRLKHKRLDNVEALDKSVFNETSQMVIEGLLEVKRM